MLWGFIPSPTLAEAGKEQIENILYGFYNKPPQSGVLQNQKHIHSEVQSQVHYVEIKGASKTALSWSSNQSFSSSRCWYLPTFLGS